MVGINCLWRPGSTSGYRSDPLGLSKESSVSLSWGLVELQVWIVLNCVISWGCKRTEVMKVTERKPRHTKYENQATRSKSCISKFWNEKLIKFLRLVVPWACPPDNAWIHKSQHDLTAEKVPMPGRWLIRLTQSATPRPNHIVTSTENPHLFGSLRSWLGTSPFFTFWKLVQSMWAV